MLLGVPTKPMQRSISDAIAELVRGIAGIREAYLPQCYVKAIVEPPAQVLVLLLEDATDHQQVLDTVGRGLATVLPERTHLDVWLMTGSDNLLSTVRGTRTHIHCSPTPVKKPWWKIFG